MGELPFGRKLPDLHALAAIAQPTSFHSIGDAQVGPGDRLAFTLFIAIAVHATVILGVNFGFHERPRKQSNTLDVILVQQKTAEAPQDADFLAQANQEGGGESEDVARPATPLRAPFTNQEANVAAASLPSLPLPAVGNPIAAEDNALVEPTRAQAPQAVLSQSAQKVEDKVASSEATKLEAKPEPEPQPKPASGEVEPVVAPEPSLRNPTQPTQTIDAASLISRSLAIASINAELDRRIEAYAKRPKRKWITASTREHKYASYMEAWRSKVERVGRLNYPDEARRRRMSGSLLLDVALNQDGTINEILLRRSSGKRALDDAAIRIVKLAAPFAKFPKGISEETDILHIERTWQFSSGEKLLSK